MNAIVAVDRNWAIGFRGDLLCHSPGDLKYFKEKKKGKIVLMGRTTFESLPGRKPLSDRINIILSRNPAFHAPCLVCHTVNALDRELAHHAPDDVFVIGGASIYRKFLKFCDKVYVTKIDTVFEADCHFPNLDEDPDFELVWTSDEYEESGIKYRFTEYRRKNW